MLADRPIHTALPATDLERARRFYAERAGRLERRPHAARQDSRRGRA